MIITTTDEVAGKEIVEVKGLVRGNSVRARAIGRDITAGLRNLVGGELPEYTQLLAESRELAVQRMTERAEAMGANAVVGARFITAGIASGASEIVAYGTAVKLAD